MKKILVVLLSIISLVSCDLAPYRSTHIADEDAFSRTREKQILTGDIVAECNGVIRFPVISDAHCGRELFDDGVVRFNENLLHYIEDMHAAGDRFPLLMLGDILDKEDQNAIDETEAFIRDIHEANPDMEIVYTCGNHELQDCMVEDWEKRYGDLGRKLDDKLNLTGSYVIGDVEDPALMIYNVNSAYRMYGRRQLSALEAALEENLDRNGGLKLITTHIPLSSSKLNQTMFNFIIGDERERNAMLRLMHEYGPTFMLAGHHHKGNTFNSYSDVSSEFIFSAFHRRGEWMESPGRWYIFEIDTNTGKGDIWGISLRTRVPYGSSSEELDKLAEEHYAFELRK